MKSVPVRLPGKFHGQRSLVGCSPWGCKESDRTECAHTHTHTHTHINITWSLSWLAAFTWQNTFEIHSCFLMYQQSIPFITKSYAIIYPKKLKTSFRSFILLFFTFTSLRNYSEWDSYCFLCSFWVISSLTCVCLCVYNVCVLCDLLEIRILNKKK